MEIEEKAEELLETIWLGVEEGQDESLTTDGLSQEEQEAVTQLLKAGYIAATGGQLYLTDKGRPVARNVVRRHRLAERLLADVLGAGDTILHEKACKFEHLLDRGLDESVCTLLGHPKICPHGKPIPPGRCCRQGKAPARKLVSSLSQLSPGQRGKVAYVHAPESTQLQKLMAMGILPGAPIDLVQSFPSYVFKVGQTEFAVDLEIAEAIYVRLVEPEALGEMGEELVPARRRGRGLGRRLGRWWSRAG
jgi:DtxR family Mn-dependent transcriptional regulator